MLLLTIIGFYLGIQSLRLHTIEDSSAMFSFAYFVDHFHLVPYRQFWDVNMPGAYACYVAAGKLAGFHDFGIRIVDLCILAVISLNTWLVIRTIDRFAALWAVALFAVGYLINVYASMQREYFFILLLSTALVCAVVWTPRYPALRQFVVGLLLGACVTIKPHWGLVAPLFLLHELRGPLNTNSGQSAPTERRNPGGAVLAFAAGGVIAPAAMIWYLSSHHALNNLLTIARDYYPVYARLFGPPQWGPERLKYMLVQGVRLGGHRHPIWVAMAVAGCIVYLKLRQPDRSRRALVLLLAGLLVVLAIVPAISGQFFHYHYVPMLYIAALLGALLFVEQPAVDAPRFRLYPVVPVVLAAVICFMYVRDARRYPFITDWEKQTSVNVVEIGNYLRSHLRPGDAVQPMIGFTGGLDFMMRGDAHPATRYLFDGVFYWRRQEPYVQQLRDAFMREFTAARPRYVVELLGTHGASQEDRASFGEFFTVLHAQYQPVARGTDYLIWERR